jgi:4-aminobutyrate aminotransferase-like enzyme
MAEEERAMGRLLRTGLNAGMKAPRVVGGSGVYFDLADGRRVLDGSNTGGPLGHGHPRMIEALRAAAGMPMVRLELDGAGPGSRGSV